MLFRSGGDAAQRQSAMAQADQQPRAGEQSTTQEQTTQQPPAMVTADPAETPAGPDQQSTTGQPPAQTAQTTSTEQPRSTEAPTQQAAGDVEQRREQERVLVERAEVGTPADFVGYEVYNAQGEQIGDVDYAVRSRSDDQIYLVVGFSGFLGIGEKLAAVPLSEFQLTPDSRLALPNETEDTLDARPEYPEEEFIALE